METIPKSRRIGSFLGYPWGRAYLLAEGSVGSQGDRGDEPCYREEPACRLMKDPTGWASLGVQGTSGVVVVILGERRWTGFGAS
jgi:hypothetical protein